MKEGRADDQQPRYEAMKRAGNGQVNQRLLPVEIQGVLKRDKVVPLPQRKNVPTHAAWPPYKPQRVETILGCLLLFRDNEFAAVSLCRRQRAIRFILFLV
jgi:hypothetical protein